MIFLVFICSNEKKREIFRFCICLCVLSMRIVCRLLNNACVCARAAHIKQTSDFREYLGMVSQDQRSIVALRRIFVGNCSACQMEQSAAQHNCARTDQNNKWKMVVQDFFFSMRRACVMQSIR